MNSLLKKNGKITMQGLGRQIPMCWPKRRPVTDVAPPTKKQPCRLTGLYVTGSGAFGSDRQLARCGRTCAAPFLQAELTRRFRISMGLNPGLFAKGVIQRLAQRSK